MQEELSKLRQDISSQTKQTISQQQALQQQMEAEKRLLEEWAQRAEEDGLYRSSQCSTERIVRVEAGGRGGGVHAKEGAHEAGLEEAVHRVDAARQVAGILHRQHQEE